MKSGLRRAVPYLPCIHTFSPGLFLDSLSSARGGSLSWINFLVPRRGAADISTYRHAGEYKNTDPLKFVPTKKEKVLT